MQEVDCIKLKNKWTVGNIEFFTMQGAAKRQFREPGANGSGDPPFHSLKVELRSGRYMIEYLIWILSIKNHSCCKVSVNGIKGHNREDMQADDYLTIPCIFIMGSNTLCGRLLATFSPHNIMI